MFHVTEKKVQLNGGSVLTDFELDAYAQLDLEIDLSEAAELEIVLGEVRTADAVEREPGGSRVVFVMKKECSAGTNLFAFDLPPHKKAYPYTLSVPLPPEAEGREIAPFRYVEIIGGKGTAVLRRKEIYGEFDDSAADFVCDNSTINRLWQFCKYTMKATGAFGLYIDGDRERQPYEGDALINLLGDLCCGGAAITAKRTLEWLLDHPTHFVEWQLVTPFLLKEYWMYTGDRKTVDDLLPCLRVYLENFKPQCNGLLKRETVPYFVENIPQLRDLIDWPMGERDNYEVGDFNLVPNCYYAASMQVMYELTGDEEYSAKAEKSKAAILENFAMPDGTFADSLCSSHTALHSALYPVSFKFVQLNDAIKNIILSKKMSCSVYTAQFLLEYCLDNGLADHAFDLLLSNDLKSYNNMIAKGATIAMEAWDNSLKPNQDWNHAWGAAPANLIPRCIAGIKPIAPGFARFSVAPHPGPLKKFYCLHPTPAGAVELSYEQGRYTLTVPENTEAVINGNTILKAGRHTFGL